MTFATGPEVEAIRGIWGTVVARDHEAARDWALKTLRQDLVKPDEGESPDAYLYRANAVPLGLMGARQFAIADDIYDRLIAQVDAFNATNQVRKHRGALLANQAVCQIILGKFDKGVPRLMFTINDEDWKTFGEPQSATPAMRHLRDLFELPALRMLAAWSEITWISATGAKPTADDFESAIRPLETGRWSLFATVLRTVETWQSYRDYPSDYAGPRLLDGIRGLALSLELLAKSIGRGSSDSEVVRSFRTASRLTLFKSYRRLFDRVGPPWWTEVKKADKEGLTRFDAGESADDFNKKLKELARWSAQNLDALTAKSLTIANLCRNYSAHELQPASSFTSDDDSVPFIVAVTHSAIALLALSRAASALGLTTEDTRA